MSERVGIFIDGGYLDYVLRDAGVFGKLDYAAFADRLRGQGELFRA